MISRILYYIILITMLSGTSALCEPINFEWQTPKDEIMKEYKLKRISVPTLEHNIKSLFTMFEATKYEVFFLESEQSHDSCGIQISYYLTFYENRLVFLLLETDEMPYQENHAQGKCAAQEIFSNIPKSWSYFSENIHGESGIFGISEDENNYFVEQKMFGENGPDDPHYLQYIFYLFDKEFIDRKIAFKLKIYSSNAEIEHLTHIFTLAPSNK